MKLKIPHINRHLVADNAFHIINVSCLLSLIICPGRVGLPSSIAILLILLFNINCIFLLNKDVVFSLFLLINVLSIFAYTFNGCPITLYIKAIPYNLIPSMLYLLGASQAGGKNETDIVKSILHPCIFVMAFGLFFYLFFRKFYYDHIGQSLEMFMWGENDYRFGSYFTSMIVGSICVCSIPMLVSLLKEYRKTTTFLYAGLIVLSLVLCMQRGAWFTATVSVVVLFIVSPFSFNTKLSTIVTIIVAIILLGVLIILFKDRIFSLYQINFLKSRLNTLRIDQMVGERLYQWRDAIRIFFIHPFGMGLGSFGHKAAEMGLKSSADGNYFRILVEVGFEGILCFLVLLINGSIRLIKSKQYYLFLSLLGFIMQGVGTNVFDLTFCSAIFWFLLGYANHSKKVVYESKLMMKPAGNQLMGAEKEVGAI